MAQFNSQMESIIKNKLDKTGSSVEFNGLWKQHQKRTKKMFGIKKIVVVPMAALLSLVLLLTVGFSFAAIEDNTDYPFVNDSSVIGKWQAVDLVDEPDQFVPGQYFSEDPLFLKQLAFIKDGEMLMSVNKGNSQLLPTDYTWTKEIVLNKQQKTASKYDIKQINGVTYMFFEWKCGDYTYFHMKPPYFVLKQIDNNDYSNYKLTRKKDKIDYPFINDPQLLGVWESVDFVPEIDKFKAGAKISRGELFLTRFDILENGKITGTTSKSKIPEDLLTWTKGFIIEKKSEVASKYEIKEINGDTYLFYEWKNGGYIYGDMQPEYYVLKKIK